ncbi:MAG: DnaJ domain-containing protein [Euryarchaeota archaeon]|nr:DnaJ domain-containing protein [Euryarchaeota archaeon]
MPKRDYYDVLGLPKTASPDDIRSAYRKLARQYHPDMNKENPKVAEEKFKELSEAYEVLADEQKRRHYDMGGFDAVSQDFGPQGFNWQNFSHAGDLEDLFGGADPLRDFFRQAGVRGDLFGGIFGPGFQPSTRGRGRDLEVTLSVPIGDLVQGVEREVELNRAEACLACKGTGAEKGTAIETCRTCNGTGQVRQVRRSGYTQLVTISDCPTCRGSGQRVVKSCPECGGAGRRRVPRRLRIKVPPGLQEGTILRLSGEGERGPTGRAGDLYVQVLVEPSRFLRDGRDVHTELTVNLSQALLGDTVRISTLTAHADLAIPPGTQPESTLRLKGEGLPHPGGGSRGDLFVTVHVRLPDRLSSEQRELVRQQFGPPPGAVSEEPGRSGSGSSGGFFGRRRG